MRLSQNGLAGVQRVWTHRVLPVFGDGILWTTRNSLSVRTWIAEGAV